MIRETHQAAAETVGLRGTGASFKMLAAGNDKLFTSLAMPQDLATGTMERNMRKRAAELRVLFSKLGPSFVKIGQALSARPDLLPQAYLEVKHIPVVA